jgi:solute carrier family 25 phosphate transporter 23/24/25/41
MSKELPQEAVDPDQEARIKALFKSMDVRGNNRIDAEALTALMIQRYEPFDGLEQVVEQLMDAIGQYSVGEEDGVIDYDNFRKYICSTEQGLEKSFRSLDVKKDGVLDLDEIRLGFDALNLDIDDVKTEMLFNVLDSDSDGYITLQDWRDQLLFVPKDKEASPLQAAYTFFIEDLDLSSEGDVLLSSETTNGVGYFLAGGLAGVVSRTCTAPFDRLKVYLIAQSGTPPGAAVAAAAAAKTISEETAAAARKGLARHPIIAAVKHLWSQGGIRAFFVGNGLNIVKVFPESAMKFGSFEATKRFLSTFEGVADPSELSRGSTFLAGGIGGMAAQLTVYPIDTLKFRIQCEAQFSKYTGNRLLVETASKMWADGGLSVFYRGLHVGVVGIFPFAALDLGIFSALKRAYITSQAIKYDVDESDIKLGNLVVLTMGALSGSIGASVVYPVNLLRTRLQAQGTAGHPYHYTGFRDVVRKTIQRDGHRGLWRGLAPNLAKVAPAVSISYLVYEKAKSTMDLD